jgi:hypothetical protein
MKRPSFCYVARQRQTIGRHTVHVAAGRQILFSRKQTAYNLNRAWAMGILETIQKDEPHIGYQINLRSRAIGRKIFTTIERRFLKS